MVPRNQRGQMMKLRRALDDGQVHEADIEAMDLGPEHGITFRVDADVQDGDEVTDTPPNGKQKTMKLHNVHVLQRPGRTSQLDHTGAKCTLVSSRTALTQPTPVTLPGLHPLISAASGSQIVTKHFDPAVFEAFKAIEERVQALTGHPKTPKGDALGGKGLMTLVFSEQAPLLDITSDGANEAQEANEREGFKYLFMGVAQALRYTRGHGPPLQTGEQEAMEMLATASLLMQALDRAQQRKQKAQKTPTRSLSSGARGRQVT